MNERCLCEREKEIEAMKEDIKKLEALQYSDHDLLVILGVKFDQVTHTLETLVKKVDLLTSQPGDRYDKLKLVAATTLVTTIIAYIVQMVLR